MQNQTVIATFLATSAIAFGVRPERAAAGDHDPSWVGMKMAPYSTAHPVGTAGGPAPDCSARTREIRA